MISETVTTDLWCNSEILILWPCFISEKFKDDHRIMSQATNIEVGSYLSNISIIGNYLQLLASNCNYFSVWCPADSIALRVNKLWLEIKTY